MFRPQCLNKLHIINLITRSRQATKRITKNMGVSLLGGGFVNFTSLLTRDSLGCPYLSVNRVRKSLNSGNSAILAAAYMRDCTASLQSSGHSLNQKKNGAKMNSIYIKLECKKWIELHTLVFTHGRNIGGNTSTELLNEIVASYHLLLNQKPISLHHHHPIKQ